MTKIEELRMKILAANKAYWQDAKPIISDVEYDKLVNTYAKLCPNDPITNKVDADMSYGVKVKHKEKMYSLGKCYDFDSVLAWLSKYARNEDELIDCQVKMDGLSAELVDGRLVSRGDGEIGNDISHLIPYIDVWMDLSKDVKESASFMINAPYWKSKRIVGELLITNKDFARAQTASTLNQYKTPRNMAAGLCNQKPETIRDLMTQFRGKLLTLVSHEAYSITRTLCQLRKEISTIATKLRGYKDLPCDGVVFKFHDRDYAKSLGFTAKYPLGALAYKFAEDQVDVVVKNIVWQTGELHVTPVAEFDPVELDGVVIRRVTLHCAQFVKDNNVCIGSVLTIIRQGGVIPKVVNVVTQAGLKYSWPTKCPECDGVLQVDGAYLSCTNDNCTARIAARITRGLKILGTLGIGPSLVLQVVKDFMIPDIMTWFDEVNDSELLRSKGYTAFQINSLCASINKILTNPIDSRKILCSVCIEDVGNQFADSVNNYAGGIIHLIDAIDPGDVWSKLSTAPGINTRALTNFCSWYKQNATAFSEYAKKFNILPIKKQDVLDELIDRVRDIRRRVYCFTGAGHRPRSEYEAICDAKGHSYTENANQCDVLVAADPNGNSGKLRKARAKGTRIISYDEFEKMLSS